MLIHNFPENIGNYHTFLQYLISHELSLHLEDFSIVSAVIRCCITTMQISLIVMFVKANLLANKFTMY